MDARLTLISHVLCPYVQRAVIALEEKKQPYRRIDIDLANKPDWFLKLSPLAKTPVLLVDDQPIFESAVICEFLEETTDLPLHPADPLVRAQHRAWMAFASAVLDGIARLYGAPDETHLLEALASLQRQFTQLESALATKERDGPYFGGAAFSMVDAAFAPAFRYFDVIDAIEGIDVLAGLPMLRAWRSSLQQRPSVQGAVTALYPELLRAFLLGRQSALSRRMAAAA